MRSDLTMKTPERRQKVKVFYCQHGTYFTPFSSVSIVEFEQVNVRWVENDLHNSNMLNMCKIT